jgi:hypothetical protein
MDAGLIRSETQGMPQMIHLNVYFALPVRPGRGDQRHTDGRLMKMVRFTADTLNDCKAEARAHIKASEAHTGPDYIEVIRLEAFSADEWKRDCLKAIPFYTATAI